MEQSSEGPHSPSPHTQLQGGDPPVQLQTPALQSAMTCLRQAPLACPLIPLAASSLQAFRPHREEAVATGDTMAAPSASIAKPARTLRATMADLLRLVRPLACQPHHPSRPLATRRRRRRLGLPPRKSPTMLVLPSRRLTEGRRAESLWGAEKLGVAQPDSGHTMWSHGVEPWGRCPPMPPRRQPQISYRTSQCLQRSRGAGNYPTSLIRRRSSVG